MECDAFQIVLFKPSQRRTLAAWPPAQRPRRELTWVKQCSKSSPNIADGWRGLLSRDRLSHQGKVVVARGFIPARLRSSRSFWRVLRTAGINHLAPTVPSANIDVWLTIFLATATSSYSRVIISMPSSPDPVIDAQPSAFAAPSPSSLHRLLAGPDIHRQRFPDADRRHRLEPLPIDRQRPGPRACRPRGICPAGAVHAAHRACGGSIRSTQDRGDLPNVAGADRPGAGDWQRHRQRHTRDDFPPRVPARRSPLFRNADHPSVATEHRAGSVVSPRRGRRAISPTVGHHRRPGPWWLAVCLRQRLGLRADRAALCHCLLPDAQPAGPADATEQGQGDP